MAKTGKGSKIKFTLNVDEASMGEKTLAQCDFKVDFYASLNNQTTSNVFTASKVGSTLTNCVKDSEDDNTYYCVCDTSGLDIGKLSATFTVEYTDAQLGQTLKDVMTLATDIALVNVPVSENAVQENNQENNEETETT